MGWVFDEGEVRWIYCVCGVLDFDVVCEIDVDVCYCGWCVCDLWCDVVDLDGVVVLCGVVYCVGGFDVDVDYVWIVRRVCWCGVGECIYCFIEYVVVVEVLGVIECVVFEVLDRCFHDE